MAKLHINIAIYIYIYTHVLSGCFTSESLEICVVYVHINKNQKIVSAIGLNSPTIVGPENAVHLKHKTSL